MIAVFKKTDDHTEPEMVQSTALVFDHVIDNHARASLTADDYQTWSAMSKSDMQARLLFNEAFDKFFPTDLKGYGIICFAYEGARLAELPPVVTFTYIGAEFYAALEEDNEFFVQQLRSWIAKDSADDEYRQLRKVAVAYPFLAAACMPMAMTYFQCGGLPTAVHRSWSRQHKAASFTAPILGSFFDLLEDAHIEGIALWRKGAIKLLKENGSEN